jgi:hypothetical protein
VHEGSEVGRRNGPFKIGVGEDDKRRVATQLEQHPFQMPCSRLGDDTPDAG